MNDNLYAILSARFPTRTPAHAAGRGASGRDDCAIEALTADGPPRYYTWGDIESATGKLANLLASLKLPPASRIAVQVEKSPEALLLYLACLRAGHVYLPLNTAYQAAEIDYFTGNAEPAVIVHAPASDAWIAPIAKRHGVAHRFTLDADRGGSLLAAAATRSSTFRTVARKADDLAAILYTSGTTGRSKGAMLSHGNLAANARTLHLAWRWRPSDVLLHALPIFHVHGLFVASHGALYAGAKTIWLDRYEPRRVIDAMPRSTVFMGVPTLYTRLLDTPAFDRNATRAMRLFVAGSAPLLTDTFRQFESRTGHRILERYGMSETVMLTSNPYDGNRMAGTVGMPLPGVGVRVAGDGDHELPWGEIGGVQVRGPNVFAGYWRMPEKTREEFTVDGWFRTGDVGSFDANGYLSIVGRSKDLIITGGYNVYPKEIESWLDDSPGVLESAVIGVPDRDFGEAVVAVVVPANGARPDPAALIAAMKGRIAGFKVPKRIHIVDELPRNQMGKVQKAALRERFGQA